MEIRLANLALGQVHFEVDEQGRAKTSDVFDASAMTPKQYLVKSRESLSLAGDILQGKAEGGPVGLVRHFIRVLSWDYLEDLQQHRTLDLET